MSPIHPKTGGAAVGAALATFVVALLNSFHGIHVPADVATAGGGLVAALGAFLAPAGPSAPSTPPTPAQAPQAPQASSEPVI